MRATAGILVWIMLYVWWRMAQDVERKIEMAGRLPKIGLDYASWDIDIFDKDTKIDKLLDAHGWNGFAVYFYLCQRAYGGEGYFYQWGYDDCASTARKMGGGIGSGTVRETVGYCLQIGLFHKGLFDRWGVLTSRGIQKRYCMAIRDRDVKRVIAEYWLLQKNEECKGLLKLPLNTNLSERNVNFPTGNSNFPEENTNFLPIKESKVKKSKVYKNTSYSFADPAEPDADKEEMEVITLTLNDKTNYPVCQKDIDTWSCLYPAIDVMQELRKMKDWCDSNPAKRKTKRGVKRFISGWLMRAQDKGGSGKYTKYEERTVLEKGIEEEEELVGDDW